MDLFASEKINFIIMNSSFLTEAAALKFSLESDAEKILCNFFIEKLIC